jgi:hypothetical protein
LYVYQEELIIALTDYIQCIVEIHALREVKEAPDNEIGFIPSLLAIQ